MFLLSGGLLSDMPLLHHGFGRSDLCIHYSEVSDLCIGASFDFLAKRPTSPLVSFTTV
jgi:hypothetical protein